LGKGDLFNEIKFKKFLVRESFTKRDFIKLINSYSWIISLKNEKKKDLLAEVEKLLSNRKEPIRAPREYKVIIAKKLKQ